jgi:hypothetical protein
MTASRAAPTDNSCARPGAASDNPPSVVSADVVHTSINSNAQEGIGHARTRMTALPMAPGVGHGRPVRGRAESKGRQRGIVTSDKHRTQGAP